ncbi:MAG: hypothetical protein MZU91_13995 [Desulfosudis oleivorans]|nr:hypothetical protein [Desulfosudis oleivorans]
MQENIAATAGFLSKSVGCAYGYFIYDECRFYPDDKIVFRDKEFRLSETTFINQYGYAELQKKSRTFTDKLKEQVSLAKIALSLAYGQITM